MPPPLSQARRHRPKGIARAQQLALRRRAAYIAARAQQARAEWPEPADVADDQRPPMMQQSPMMQRSPIIESSEAAGWWNPATGVAEDLPTICTSSGEGYTWPPLVRVPATAAAAQSDYTLTDDGPESYPEYDFAEMSRVARVDCYTSFFDPNGLK